MMVVVLAPVMVVIVVKMAVEVVALQPWHFAIVGSITHYYVYPYTRLWALAITGPTLIGPTLICTHSYILRYMVGQHER